MAKMISYSSKMTDYRYNIGTCLLVKAEALTSLREVRSFDYQELRNPNTSTFSRLSVREAVLYNILRLLIFQQGFRAPTSRMFFVNQHLGEAITCYEQ